MGCAYISHHPRYMHSRNHAEAVVPTWTEPPLYDARRRKRERNHRNEGHFHAHHIVATAKRVFVCFSSGVAVSLVPGFHA